MDRVLYVVELKDRPEIHQAIGVLVQVEDLLAKEYDARSFLMFEQVKIA